MKRVLWSFLVLIFLVVMAGCVEDLPISEEKPTPEVIALQLTPAVAHWLPLVATCAEGIPNFGISTQVLPRSDLSLAESDLILRLGEQFELDPFAALMGVEEIVIIAGADVPLETISLESLRLIYSGNYVYWGDVPQAVNEVNGIGQPIKPLSYPLGHEVEILFRRAYLDDELIAVDPQVFLTIPFLENLLATYPFAIGYLLRSQVSEDMQVIEIVSDETIVNQQFVLAVTSAEPTGGLKQLLLCLQNAE